MRSTLVIALFLMSQTAWAGECASTLEDLKKTPRLKAVQELFAGGTRVGFVNETNGSYVVMGVAEGKLDIHFYTSGLWDLYAIKDEGPLQFCDDGEKLVMSGLGRSEALKIAPNKMEIGGGGPKRTFHVGPMPELLRKLHKLDERGLASVP
jgi:hypothetical protein